MKINELRVGNIINYVDAEYEDWIMPVEILELDEEGFITTTCPYFGNHGKMHTRIYDDSFDFIPLPISKKFITEQSTQFKKKKLDKGHFQLTYKTLTIDFISNTTINIMCVFDGLMINPELKYIHELQNWYDDLFPDDKLVFDVTDKPKLEIK